MDRTAFITGGTRGIGRAVALELARCGFRIAVNYVHNEEAATQLATEIKALGAEVLLLQGDVSRSEEATRMVKEVRDRFGGLDVLVNNAGISKDNLFLRTTDEELQRTIEVNLYGAFYCARAAARLMTKNSYGRIINLSSVVGLTGNIGQSAYSASKAALLGFTKTLAKELARRNVTVNAVAPGFIQTEMTEALDEESKAAIGKRIPLQRLGQVEEVAKLVAFLASEESGYITGQTLVIDGGLSL